MKKRLLALTLSLAMLLPIAACGSSSGEGSASPEESSAPASSAPAGEETAAATAPEGYPDGPISVLVGFTAGGGSDLAVRTFNKYFTPLIGEAVTVSNQPGGGATVAVAQLQNSAANGQTLGLVTLSSQSVSPYSLDLPYTIDDFEYLGAFAAFTYAILVPADSEYQDFDDLLEATKSGPIQMSTTSNLHELLARKIIDDTGADLETVYYSGTSDAITDLLGGFIPVALGDIASYSAYVESGQLRVLCSASDTRWPVAPDAPTLMELGYENSAINSYTGLAVPKGTDPAIVAYLQALFAQVANDPAFQEELYDVTKMEATPMTGDEYYEVLVNAYNEAGEILGSDSAA